MHPLHPDMLDAEVDETRRRLGNEPTPPGPGPPSRALVGALLACFAAVVIVASLDREQPDDLPAARETAPITSGLSEIP